VILSITKELVVIQMIINKSDYRLSELNFVKKETKKNRIIIGNSFSTKMNHFIGWTTRWFGSYNKCANYTVTLSGEIIEHFPPKYYSQFLNNLELNKKSISIVLENEGWLVDNPLNSGQYVNYIGEVYGRDDNVVDKKWRNKRFWAPYSIPQLDSATLLVRKLCTDFNIPINVIPHNISFDEPDRFSGVLYKSNFKKYYSDVSPAWDFIKFKDKVENDK